MSTRDRTLVTSITFERVLPWSANQEVRLEIEGELRYEQADPFAVTLTFFTPGSPVSWTLARDLLLDGCYERAGEGDVRVMPCLDRDGRSVVRLALTSPHGAAMLTARTPDVVDFCQQVFATVPPGTESDHVDVDSVIDRLLQDA